MFLWGAVFVVLPQSESLIGKEGLGYVWWARWRLPRRNGGYAMQCSDVSGPGPSPSSANCRARATRNITELGKKGQPEMTTNGHQCRRTTKNLLGGGGLGKRLRAGVAMNIPETSAQSQAGIAICDEPAKSSIILFASQPVDGMVQVNRKLLKCVS